MKNAEKKVARRDFLVGSGRTMAGAALGSSLADLGAPATKAQEILVKEATIPAATPVVRYDVDASWPNLPARVGAWSGNPAIMIDGKQQVWISNRAFPAMLIFDSNGRFIRAWDNDKLFSEKNPALFLNKEKGPYNLHFFRFEGNNVWIANTNRHIIQKCDLDGNVLMTIGTPDAAGTDESHFSRPTDMTITTAGVFISDGYGNRRVVHCSLDGKFIKAWGKEGTGPEDFIDPHAICCVNNHLYVVDRGNVRIKVYNFDGKLLDIWRNLLIAWPLIPTANDEIWTCGVTPIKLENYAAITGGKQQQDQIVVKFNADGKILQIYGFPTAARGTGHVPGKLNMLHGMAVDAQGNLYLGEAFNPGPQKWVRSTELRAKVLGEFPPAGAAVP